jgi:hypothetical protein
MLKEEIRFQKRSLKKSFFKDGLSINANFMNRLSWLTKVPAFFRKNLPLQTESSCFIP